MKKTSYKGVKVKKWVIDRYGLNWENRLYGIWWSRFSRNPTQKVISVVKDRSL